MKRRIHIHIGQGKTGTSAIQAYLKRHRSELAEQGFLVPLSPGSPRHGALSLYHRPDQVMLRAPQWRKLGFDSPDALRHSIEVDLVREIEASPCPNVVLSDEALYNAKITALNAISKQLANVMDELVIVVYLRRQDDHARSRYKQSIREGRSHSLIEFLELKRPQRHYYEHLVQLRSHFPQAKLVVRPYHRSLFKAESLTSDFCRAIGARPIPGNDEVDVNPSLDAPSTEFVRRYNAACGRMPAPLLRKFTDLSNGPDLKLPEDVHRRFMALFAESNERLVREFMPEAEDIFLAPPKPTDGICQEDLTIEQVATAAARVFAAIVSEEGDLKRQKNRKPGIRLTA